MFEPEGNACSLTDSTAEEHVLALVEHAADEARDRINRLVPGGKVALPNGMAVFLPGQWHGRHEREVSRSLRACGRSPAGVPAVLLSPEGSAPRPHWPW